MSESSQSVQQLPNDERQLLRYIPNNQNVNAACKRCYEDYEHAQSAQVKRAQLTEAERMLKSKDLFEEVLVAHQTGVYKDTFKLANKALKTLAGREIKTVSANTPAVRAVIWILLNQICRTKFELMARTEDGRQRLKKYITGETKFLDITVSTSWLANAAKLNAGSFRGTKEGQIYNSLSRLGFAERRNFKLNGEQAISGQEVSLRINVSTWFFDHTHALDIKTPVVLTKVEEISTALGVAAPSDSPIFLTDDSGNSTQIKTLNLKNKEQSEVARLSGGMSSATSVATSQVKGEVDCPAHVEATTTSVKFAPGPATAATPQITKVAEECLKLMFQTIFNAENLAKYKIRTDAETAITFISPTSQAVCRERLTAIITRLTNDGMSTPDIAEEIIKYTTKTGKSLQNGTKEYVYAPEMWLRQDYHTGTLFANIQRNDPNTVKIPQNQTTKPDALDTEGVYISAQIAWVIAQGFAPRTLWTYRRRHGDLAIAQAAEWAQLALESDKHIVKTTVERYLNNVFQHLKPETIQERVSLLKAKLGKNVIKPGHILQKWVDYILENTFDQNIIKAWQRATVAGMSGNIIDIQVLSVAHANLLQTPESVALWKAARKATGLDFKVEFVIKQVNKL